MDWKIISQIEGTRNDGYIPPQTPSNNPNQKHDIVPGVTIASGFDVGQRSESDLREMGLSEDVISKLRPYLNKTGQDAQKALQDYGTPYLTDDEVSQVNEAAHRDTLNKFKEFYDEEVGEGKPHFDELPSHIQTALASVAFQWGPGFGYRDDSASGQKLWNEVIAQDWGAAERTLRQWGSNIPAYADRRNQEADLINPDSETTIAHKDKVASKTKKKSKQKAPLRSKPHAVRRHHPWGDIYDI